MTREELAVFDGQDGRPAYIAVNGTIYDVSASPRWRDGDHEGAHQAGRDLTEEIKSAPHVRAVIERFPVSGRFEDPVAQPSRNRILPLLTLAIAIVLVMFWVVLTK